MLTQTQLAEAYRQACEIELQAFKPGNVSIYSAGHDMTVADFRTSAEVSAEPITRPEYSLGEKIYYAVKATRAAVACNTNLGIVLLCAPLLQAAYLCRPGQSLQQALSEVLDNTSITDAEWVFKAIRLAAPGGLGEAARQDVNQAAEVDLRQAMALAGDRDRIAYQYAYKYKDIFEFSILEYNRAFVLSDDSGWAALAVYCEMLARFPDSHIERKYGKQYTDWVQSQILPLCDDIRQAHKLEQVWSKLQSIDKALKAKKINPGTTADMTVATVLAVSLRESLDTINTAPP